MKTRLIAIALLAGVLLAGCARDRSQATDTRAPSQWSQAEWAEFIVFTPLWEQDRVMNGYTEPEACRRDLSLVDAPVFYVPAAQVREIFKRLGPDSSDIAGLTPGGAAITPELSQIAGVQPGIYINEDLKDFERGVITHHERCHWATGWAHSDWKPTKR